MFFQLFSTIKVKLVDEMMQSNYLCAISHVKRKLSINSQCFYLISNS